MDVDRRGVLAGARVALSSLIALSFTPAFGWAPDVTNILELMRHPLLRGFYTTNRLGHVGPNGLGGFNFTGKQAPLIEEQRQGTECIEAGVMSGNADLLNLGWMALDIGVQWQQDDGSWGERGYFHSNALYLEALARALIVDPDGATQPRLRCLRRGVDWMLDPANAAKGGQQNAPYTHRRYILAAMFGEAGQVLGDARYAAAAVDWARQGIALQLPSGENPELSGGDASYQMAGVLFALRYYPTAPASMRPALRTMIRRAIAWELPFVGPDGKVDIRGSTRIGKELFAGVVKSPNYVEIYQALCYADWIMPTPAWERAAIKIAGFAKFPIPPQAN